MLLYYKPLKNQILNTRHRFIKNVKILKINKFQNVLKNNQIAYFYTFDTHMFLN